MGRGVEGYLPDLELKPGEYRQKRRLIYRITHASKRDLLIATAVGVWTGAVPGLRALHVEPFSSIPGGWIAIAVALGPGLIYWIWAYVLGD